MEAKNVFSVADYRKLVAKANLEHGCMVTIMNKRKLIMESNNKHMHSYIEIIPSECFILFFFRVTKIYNIIDLTSRSV